MDATIGAWSQFFAAEAGAAAALTGLLFVAVSINLARILEFPNLPTRAVESLTALVSVLVIATIGLTPGQTMFAYGIEFSIVGLLTLGAQTYCWAHSYKIASKYEVATAHMLRNIVPSLPFVIAGGSLVAGAPAGFYWLTVGVILSFAAGIVGAWVLLVEIQR